MKNEDAHFQLLIDMSKNLAVNTAATQAIDKRLDTLNSKVATNVKDIEAARNDLKADISKINRILIVIGAVVGTLLITSGSELVNFVLKII